ncbi:MAG: bifunctional phosphopantothenoylcysteine decarboxylase/phosphopantothenate--cysteine ligase CoaBC [Proteobacteria bacterium]|nr:bifunctional phosphopantothenoylcysteine decarboxylase/phosphopantothenate--cysteine ligase CoaBC [Cystobacterineae bacterium]MCL2259383.1 bifunctional phosphopantothenoylcysteine decarboxylase/phosphopantothenate--cysteine ligase CoaBC [Cystobacterineae bacterium]MCL2314164.1 bifunctional phosphopantothenoylcysteine decarboxylase/phosphopantothenate--cysteine ligase CoaBC [Pseudomonadota bacterium]
MSLQGKKVAVLVSGSIAAYKACELIRRLKKEGAEVRVAMTKAAESFVSALTFQALCGHVVLTEAAETNSAYGHLELARWADIFVFAPASANSIARMRAGFADSPLLAALLAFRGPVVVAPAMNTAMWENKRTQENLEVLFQEPRFLLISPQTGELADKDIGMGRLAGVETILQTVGGLLATSPLKGKKLLLTAGPTREYWDAFRFLSNPSTGKMGVALAREAHRRGIEVSLVLGVVAEALRKTLPSTMEVVDVVTAEEMCAAVLERVEGADCLIATAAVSDFKPAETHPQKINKTDTPKAMALLPTIDVLATASAQAHQLDKRPYLIGFAAQTQNLAEYAERKLHEKRLDAICANDISKEGVGFAADDNEILWLHACAKPLQVKGSKAKIAAFILDEWAQWENADERNSTKQRKPTQ